MKALLTGLAIFFILATAITLIRKEYWWIRIFDYPRSQLLALSLFTLAAYIFYLDAGSAFQYIIMAMLGAAVIYQSFRIYPYTPISGVQVQRHKSSNTNRYVSFLICNVRMENKEMQRVLDTILKQQADVVLLMEVNHEWVNYLQPLKQHYKTFLEEPLENTYGMAFYTKLEAIEAKFNYLIEDYIPSVYTKLKLRSGDLFEFYGLHPSPPAPGQDTEGRDAELLVVGKKIKDSGVPSVIAGDLNDVAWSHTSTLFQQISGLVDPRVGRGHYNTYNAKIPVFRYPLDHIFHSPKFKLVHIERLYKVGSDHFPMFLKLSYEPEDRHDNAQPKASAGDRKEAASKIEKGYKEAGSNK